MKVILTQDVEGLGGMGDVVDVAQGYANNFLIRRNLAVAATSGNLKHWDEKRAFIVKREAATRAEAEELAEQLEGAKIVIAAKAGEEGRLYGSVTTKDIAEEIERDLKIEVDRRKIHLPEPIKTTGDHEVSIHLYKDVNANVTVSVPGEGGTAGQTEETPAAEAGAEEATAEPGEEGQASAEELEAAAQVQAEADVEGQEPEETSGESTDEETEEASEETA